MNFNLKNLPDDTKLLHKIISDLCIEILDLKHQLNLLKKQKFSSSSEKLSNDEKVKLDKEISDLELRIENEEEKNCNKIIDKAKEEDLLAKEVTKNKPKRNPLPDHLPREKKIINPDPICPECGSEELRKISDDISETLDYIHHHLK